jgi:hypothetical protein
VGPDRPERAGMFTRQSDKEPPGSDMRGDKRLDGIDGLTVYTPLEIERGRSRDAAPLTIRLTPELLIIELDLS